MHNVFKFFRGAGLNSKITYSCPAPHAWGFTITCWCYDQGRHP